MTAVWDLPAVRRGMHEQEQALRGLLDDGAALVGWKVGVGAPASMRAAGIPAPLVGFLTSRTLVPDGASVQVQDWSKPVLEPEIAIHVGTALGHDPTPSEAEAAIAALAPAIELADVDVALDEVQRVVAGNIFHRRVILGDPDRRAGGRVDDLRIEVLRGEERIAAADDATAITGSLPDLVAHVARWLAAGGRSLEAGQVIISGSVVPIIPIPPGDVVTYRCDPLGSLSVAFG